jgi:hypothetical protein
MKHVTRIGLDIASPFSSARDRRAARQSVLPQKLRQAGTYLNFRGVSLILQDQGNRVWASFSISQKPVAQRTGPMISADPGENSAVYQSVTTTPPTTLAQFPFNIFSLNEAGQLRACSQLKALTMT